MPSLDSSTPDPRSAKTYWRSLEELADTPTFRAFVEAEFPSEAEPGGVSRRRWLQLMGASLALAGLAGCRWEKAEILPFAKRPPNRVPGAAQHFATAMDLGGNALGLLVTSFEGRPIKIEGNPKHPQSLGATDAFAQAAILEFYDPDRSTAVYRKSGQGDEEQTWDAFLQFAQGHFAELRKTGGSGLRILSEASSSPALAAMRAKLLKAFPQALWHEYEPVSRDNERAGAALAFGKPLRTHVALDKARVIVCLDADPLGDHPAAVQYARDFAKGREVTDGKMSRLYAVETCYPITGSMADHRLALRPSQIAAFAQSLYDAVRTPLAPREEGPSRGSVTSTRDPSRFLHAMAKDLAANRGQSVVMAGPRQPPEVHAMVHRINAALENLGKTVTFTEEPDPERPSHVEAIRALCDEMGAGKVDTLVILGGNPVYDAPANLGFAAAMAKAPNTIHLGLYRNETALRCGCRLPQAHFLESWGDARSYDGAYSIIQPLVEPLYGGRSAIELIAVLLGDQTARGYDLVRQSFKEMVKTADWETQWNKTLHDGILAGSRFPTVTPESIVAFRSAKVASSGGPDGQEDATFAERKATMADWSGGPLEIVFCRDASVYDGRFANSGWLQELPDPMTKLTWDNAALVSPATAKTLGVETGSVVRLKYTGREVEIPVYVMPGLAAGCVAVSLGYGRTAAGHVGGLTSDGVAPVGVDVYPLRISKAMDFGSGASIEPTGRKAALAMTQDHHAIDQIGMQGRAERLGAVVREASLGRYKEHPDFAQHAVEMPEPVSLWQEHQYPGRRWGTVIDLSKCIGCGACVVACQAENNVPVVGKERVLRGREMHWIRVDRYFQGDADAPAAVHQPVACHHCENAPCEQVCPVGATSHSHEGLNDMAYNRCVGTRYCANNCPYKVRRFNFFNYHKDLEDADHEVLKMMYNPEVTVRCRGVMEKCTYCVQRIQAAKIAGGNRRGEVHDGKVGDGTVPDGQIRTACQQVCPAQAIIFGDLNDPKSEVARAAASDRAYGMLAELNVRPRTSYLARIRNPNAELET